MSISEKWRRTLAQENFSIFCDSFKYTEPVFPPSKMHREWETLLTSAYGKYHQIMLQAPRASAKTERVTINYPLWMIGKNPNLRITICSTPVAKAEKFLSKIAERIESDKTYRSIFGVLKPDDPRTWRTDALTVKRTITSPEPSISAIGAAGQAVSKRSDVILVDDPLDSENTKTEYLRQGLIDWFNNALMPTLEPSGLAIVILTPWHESDLSQYLLKQPNWLIMRYPAVVNPKNYFDKWLETDDASLTVWPEKYGYPIPQFDVNGKPIICDGKQVVKSFLRHVYDSNVDTLMVQYLLDPYNVTGALFKSDWLHFFREQDLDWKKLILYQGWDLAISVEERADYTVCVTVAYESSTHLIYVLNVLRQKINPLEQFDAVVKQYEFWNQRSQVAQVTIESDAYQKSLSMGLIASTTLPVVGSESRGKAKLDRIALLSPHFQNGRFRLAEYLRDGEFVDEYKRFPRGSHDDQLDALQKCVEPILNRLGGGGFAFEEVAIV